MSTALAVLALMVALVALGLQVGARLGARLRARAGDPVDASDLPQDVLGLRHEVAALRAEAATALKHLAVVRYDAFADAGAGSGGLSWSLAVLDDHGYGTVLTSIHGRTEARTYAKAISAWACEQPLSPEESEAISLARAR